MSDYGVRIGANSEALPAPKSVLCLSVIQIAFPKVQQLRKRALLLLLA